MTARFTVLASGSRGNAVLLQYDGFGLLIDCGLNPRQLTAQLAAVGASWASVHAVLLTHTHADHWKDKTLADLRSRRIRLWGHSEHFDQLAVMTPSFEPLHRAGLTRCYAADRPWELVPGLTVWPVPVSHDAEPTFAFRIEARGPALVSDRPLWAVAYASDLGCWTPELARRFAGVDVLAVEYNHDVALEQSSGRSARLVRRVLGNRGHLSNEQAAALTAAVAAGSPSSLPYYLVQLHLSRECNRPHLARAAAYAALAPVRPGTHIVTASQNIAGPAIPLGVGPVPPLGPSPYRSRISPDRPPARVQPPLPDFDP